MRSCMEVAADTGAEATPLADNPLPYSHKAERQQQPGRSEHQDNADSRDYRPVGARLAELRMTAVRLPGHP